MGMFGDSDTARIRELFADQFKPDGADFIYRKGLKGAAIRTTRAERDDFLSSFDRRLRYTTWAIVPVTVAPIALLVILFSDVDAAQAHGAIYIGLALVLAPFLVTFSWACNAPARALARRPSVAEALTREDVRRVTLARMTYGQLGLAAAGAVLLVWKVSADTDVWHGWGRTWLILAGTIFIVRAVQAIRKWLFEQKRTPLS